MDEGEPSTQEGTIHRAVANGRVGRVLARPIFSPEETTPTNLTLATVISLPLATMFVVFLVFVKLFRKK